MPEAIPEPVFPEADAYPAYRTCGPIELETRSESRIDQYVLSALIATGTELVRKKRGG
jgi:hypothetical protein